ncbi:MAG: hypothetical protein FWC41_03485 [Firmicutes bacterium]|nr:hypothetical protein [Bacillota bacterium]
MNKFKNFLAILLISGCVFSPSALSKKEEVTTKTKYKQNTENPITNPVGLFVLSVLAGLGIRKISENYAQNYYHGKTDISKPSLQNTGPNTGYNPSLFNIPSEGKIEYETFTEDIVTKINSIVSETDKEKIKSTVIYKLRAYLSNNVFNRNFDDLENDIDQINSKLKEFYSYAEIVTNKNKKKLMVIKLFKIDNNSKAYDLVEILSCFIGVGSKYQDGSRLCVGFYHKNKNYSTSLLTNSNKKAGYAMAKSGFIWGTTTNGFVDKDRHNYSIVKLLTAFPEISNYKENKSNSDITFEKYGDDAIVYFEILSDTFRE